MVFAFDPGPEEVVDLIDVREGPGVQSGDEVGSEGREPSFDLSSSLRPIGLAVDEVDAEGGTCGEDGSAAKDFGVVNVELLWAAPFHESLLEAVLEDREVLLEIELGMADQSGRVIHDGVEEGLGTGAIRLSDGGTEHHVRLPAVVWVFEGESSAILMALELDLVETLSLAEAVEGVG